MIIIIIHPRTRSLKLKVIRLMGINVVFVFKNGKLNPIPLTTTVDLDRPLNILVFLLEKKNDNSISV